MGAAALAAGAAGLVLASEDQPQVEADDLLGDLSDLSSNEGSVESSESWAPPQAEDSLDIVDLEPMSGELAIADDQPLDFTEDDQATAETSEFIEDHSAAMFQEDRMELLGEADLEDVNDEVDSSQIASTPLDLADLSLEPVESSEPVAAPEIHYHRGDDELLDLDESHPADELQLNLSEDDARLPDPQAGSSDLDWFANPNTGELTLPVPSEAEQGGELDDQYLVPEADESEEPNFDMYQTVYSSHATEEPQQAVPVQSTPSDTHDEPLALDELDFEPLDDDAVLDLDLMDDEVDLDELKLPEGDHQDFNPLATLEWTEPVSEEKEPE